MAPPPTSSISASLEPLALELRSLREAMLAFESAHAAATNATAPGYRASARNLLHYLAMRRQDLRSLQSRLAALGLSSLGRSEACALFSIDAVLEVIDRLRGHVPTIAVEEAPCDLSSGIRLLDTHAREVFGPEPHGRSTRIMVTMPGEAAVDYTLIRHLLETGMDCMRINCAHDEPAAWKSMIEHLRHASAALGRHCSVLMDLAGPKLRTGDVEAGPAVRKVKPTRDAWGAVLAPATVWLTSARAPVEAPSAAAAATLRVDPEWLAAVRTGEAITFLDARARQRALQAVDRDQGGIWAELQRTAYFTNETLLERADPAAEGPRQTAVSGIPTREGVIIVRPGDILVLTRDVSAGRGPTFDSAHQLLSPARVPCTLPEVFSGVRPGEKVCLDDGQVVGVAESVSISEIRVRVQRTPPQGARLRADKGINLPESGLELPAMTARDRANFEFVTDHADLVGLSFVNRESDVLDIIERLKAKSGAPPGLILKIETQRALARLPALLLSAMRYPRIGVMIARGDLAVECGYERLAEAQEEILWICEAAHCPSIWATQVLETLAKQGIPSRAEITDAAMGHRAECVMLNKGPHIQQAVHVLDDILKRMESHQTKKRAMLRALRMARTYADSPGH